MSARDERSTEVGLAAFLRERSGAILEAWTDRVSRRGHAATLPRTALLDHLPTLIARLADLMDLPVAPGAAPDAIPQLQGLDRLGHGFESGEVVAEYSALRAVLAQLWMNEQGPTVALDPWSRLERAIDHCIAASVAYLMAGRAKQDDALRFLADASRILASSLEVDETLRSLAELTIPRLADGCAVDVVREDGTLGDFVAIAHADPGRIADIREMRRRFPRSPTASEGLGRVLQTGESIFVPEVSQRFLETIAPQPELRAGIEKLSLNSYMTVPITVSGRHVGALSLIATAEGRRFDETDLSMAEELGRRAGVALERARLYEAAQHAVRLRDEVLAVVSHDLKNPLNAILLSAAVIAQAGSADERGSRMRKRAEVIRRSAERMDRLIHDLVDIASVEAGRLAMDLQIHETAELAREASETFSELAEDRGVRLVLDLEEELPSVPCDADRVLQVLSNLLGNAIKVTPAEGEVCIRVEADEHGVRFSVADTGPGISAEELPRIFDRFWRGERAVYQGTGLGLAIARGIVEAHGGVITAESRPGAGSVFTFTLPLTR